MAAVHDFGDGAGDGFGKAGPAAARIKLGDRVEQLGAAADAVVAAVSPVGFVLAGEGALGGGMARDLEGHGFGAFFAQHGLPFGICLLDRVGHDEQLISMEDAQSGGKAA